MLEVKLRINYFINEKSKAQGNKCKVAQLVI